MLEIILILFRNQDATIEVSFPIIMLNTSSPHENFI